MSDKIKHIIIAIIFTLSLPVFAQQNNVLEEYESELVEAFDSLFKNDGVKFIQPDTVKDSINAVIINTFEDALKENNSFEYSFSKLKRVGILTSDDNKLRIITWNIKYSNGEYTYFGFIQHFNKKKKCWDLFALTDSSRNMKNITSVTLTHNLWFGASYYQMITKKRGSKTYYTLLGWDGNNYLSQKKVIDVLYFTKSGNPRFGKTIFKIGRKKQRRVIFEYNSQVVMALTYDKRYNRIVFDHLTPSPKQMKGNYKFYVPDGSYDAFEWVDGKWIYVEDYDAKNPKSKSTAPKNEVKLKEFYKR